MVDYVPETEKIDAACISQPFFYQQFVASIFLYSFITLAAVTQKIFRKSKTCTWNALYVDKRKKSRYWGKATTNQRRPRNIHLSSYVHGRAPSWSSPVTVTLPAQLHRVNNWVKDRKPPQSQIPETTRNFIRTWLLCFGVPLYWKTVQRKQFDSEVFCEVSKTGGYFCLRIKIYKS